MQPQPQTQTIVLEDVPSHKIDQLAQEHKEMGAAKIEVIKQPNGEFSLKVTYAE
jgi:hypothetical protein